MHSLQRFKDLGKKLDKLHREWGETSVIISIRNKDDDSEEELNELRSKLNNIILNIEIFQSEWDNLNNSIDWDLL